MPRGQLLERGRELGEELGTLGRFAEGVQPGAVGHIEHLADELLRLVTLPGFIRENRKPPQCDGPRDRRAARLFRLECPRFLEPLDRFRIAATEFGANTEEVERAGEQHMPFLPLRVGEFRPHHFRRGGFLSRQQIERADMPGGRPQVTARRPCLAHAASRLGTSASAGAIFPCDKKRSARTASMSAPLRSSGSANFARMADAFLSASPAAPASPCSL